MKEAHLRENWFYITRNRGSRAYPIGEKGMPKRIEQNPDFIWKIIEWLDVEHSKRHLKRKIKGNWATNCNVYTTDVCYAAGVYLPRIWWYSHFIERALKNDPGLQIIYGKTVKEMSADSLFVWLENFGSYFGWKKISNAHEIQTMVNDGCIGIISGTDYDPKGPGHITVVLSEKQGYKAKYKIIENSKILVPLQSQAGYYNHKVFCDDWYNLPSIDKYNFYVHE